MNEYINAVDHDTINFGQAATGLYNPPRFAEIESAALHLNAKRIRELRREDRKRRREEKHQKEVALNCYLAGHGPLPEGEAPLPREELEAYREGMREMMRSNYMSGLFAKKVGGEDARFQEPLNLKELERQQKETLLQLAIARKAQEAAGHPKDELDPEGIMLPELTRFPYEPFGTN